MAKYLIDPDAARALMEKAKFRVHGKTNRIEGQRNNKWVTFYIPDNVDPVGPLQNVFAIVEIETPQDGRMAMVFKGLNSEELSSIVGGS